MNMSFMKVLGGLLGSESPLKYEIDKGQGDGIACLGGWKLLQGHGKEGDSPAVSIFQFKSSGTLNGERGERDIDHENI